MALPPLQELSTALHIGTFASTVLSETNLSPAVQRQIRHASYEYVRLREEHFGPNSRQSDPREWFMATRSLLDFFDEAAEKGMPEERLFGAAREAKRTLREIRSLRGAQHFFSENLESFFKALAMLELGGDYFNHFSSALIWELEKYRKQRDQEESAFLQPFHQYSAELMGIIQPLRAGHRFTHFEVEQRVKRDLLAKLVKRQWQDMQEFYDLVGLRIVVGCQREVGAAVALVEGALRVHEASAMLDSRVPHYFRVDHIEVKESVDAVDAAIHQDVRTGYLRKEHNDRGYRGSHINVRRHCRDDGHDHPTGEIQVVSSGIRDWGDHQRLLVRKDWGYSPAGPVNNYDQIPPEVKTVVKAYCRSGADYIAAIEDGISHGPMPDLKENILLLTRIEDDTLRSEYLDRIADMDLWMSKFPNGKAAGANVSI